MEQMMRITTKITIPSLMMPEKSTKENYIGLKKFYYLITQLHCTFRLLDSIF